VQTFPCPLFFDDEFSERSMSQSNEPTGLEIAVVGMAGRFPGAPGVDALWANLRAGV